MAFCTSCGSPLAEGAAFCSSCGQRQNASTAAPAYQPPIGDSFYEEATGILSENEGASFTDLGNNTMGTGKTEPAVATEPAYQPPVYEQPTYQAPTYEQPAHQTPVYQPPVYEQPAHQTPVYEQPAHQTPVYQPPVYEQPAYQQPAYSQYQAPAAPVSKGKSITAMVLGIVALVFCIVDLILSIGGLAVMGYRGAEEYGIMAMIYAIITLGCAVPGMILGGSTSSSTPGKLGKIFGIIGIIMGGIAFFVAFLCMVV